MSTNEELKRAILKGVLEDNLDLPKPSGGGRQPSTARPSDSVPAPPQRSRWSPAPLLIGAFLLANGAAFPRLTGEFPVVAMATPGAAQVTQLDPGGQGRGFADGAEAAPAMGQELAAAQPPMSSQREGARGSNQGLGDVSDGPSERQPDHRRRLGSAGSAHLPGSQPIVVDASGSPERALGQLAEPVQAVYRQMIEEGSIPVADLFGLRVSTIVIDPGHGGIDPGATGPNGLMEKELTLDIARRLRDKLQRSGNRRVLLTREQDVKIALKDRVEFARKHKADLFISLHFNSLPVESVNLVETFYFGPQADKRILALAEKENAGSGYAVGDFRQVIERISDTLKTQESKDLAALMQRNLYRNLRRENAKVTNAGIKTAPFVVLLGSEVPSVLAEVSCLSNELEARNLAASEYRERIAGYLRDGIVEYLDEKQKTSQNHIAKGELKHVANQQDR